MERTTVRDLADRLIEGGLEAWLRDRRANHRESMGVIARRLDREYEVFVSPQTVRLWCIEFGIPTERQPADDAA